MFIVVRMSECRINFCCTQSQSQPRPTKNDNCDGVNVCPACRSRIWQLASGTPAKPRDTRPEDGIDRHQASRVDGLYIIHSLPHDRSLNSKFAAHVTAVDPAQGPANLLNPFRFGCRLWFPGVTNMRPNGELRITH